MATHIAFGRGSLIIAEMHEFGSFAPEAQAYIRRALDLARAPEQAVDRWSRTDAEAASVEAQLRIYRLLPGLRDAIPQNGAMAPSDTFLLPLIAVSIFDVRSSGFSAFAPYRFLYERLLGGAIRPWLPGAFSAAAAMPHVKPARCRALLASVARSLTDRWSLEEPAFIPEWLAS